MSKVLLGFGIVTTALLVGAYLGFVYREHRSHKEVFGQMWPGFAMSGTIFISRNGLCSRFSLAQNRS